MRMERPEPRLLGSTPGGRRKRRRILRRDRRNRRHRHRRVRPDQATEGSDSSARASARNLRDRLLLRFGSPSEEAGSHTSASDRSHPVRRQEVEPVSLGGPQPRYGPRASPKAKIILPAATVYEHTHWLAQADRRPGHIGDRDRADLKVGPFASNPRSTRKLDDLARRGDDPASPSTPPNRGARRLVAAAAGSA